MEFTAEMIKEVGVLWSLVAALLAMFIDAILGIALAIKRGDFDASKLPQFLKTGVLPNILVLVSLAIGVLLAPGTFAAVFAGFFITAFLTIAGKYGKEIPAKIEELSSKPPAQL